MPNRSSKKQPRDINQLAAQIAEEASAEIENPIPSALRHQLDEGQVHCTSCGKRFDPRQPRSWGEDASKPEGFYVWCDTCRGRQLGKQAWVPEKGPAAVELRRRGGLKGGKARAAKLTAEERREIARRAAAKRWGKPTE
jgi:hypothetical protein